MTVKELKIMLKEQNREWFDVEFYKFSGKVKRIHTDFVESIDDSSENSIVEDWQLMDEEDYDQSICANSCVSADFAEWYGSEDVKILVIVVKEEEE